MFLKKTQYLIAPIFLALTYGGGKYYSTTYMIEYPAFETTHYSKESNYEIRRYPSLPVILTIEKANDHAEALQLGFDELRLCLKGDNTRLKKMEHFNFITSQKYEMAGFNVKSYEVWIHLKKDDPFAGKPWNPYLEMESDIPGYRASKKFRGKITEERIKEESERLAQELKKDNFIITNNLCRVTKYHDSYLPFFCLNEIEYEIEKPCDASLITRQ